MKGSPSSRPEALRGQWWGWWDGGETDYSGLGAPIDGQMNQQGPPFFYSFPHWTPPQVLDMGPAHIRLELHYKTVNFVLKVLLK